LSYPCDEIVGRFCYWYDGDDDWVPPPEHERIGRARTRLLNQLDSLGSLSPGDDWILGQRVRYLVEAGRLSDALGVTQACKGTSWWCHALAGYVHHAASQFADADAAFATALAAMPAEDRCAWTDLSDVLDQAPRDYNRTPCDRRSDQDARIWWLADPLYMTPGNERRTEHFSRHVLSHMQNGARSAYAVRWGSDLHELLLRHGWPVGWERDDSRRGYDAGEVHVISHDAPRSREFLPPRRFVDATERIGPDEWDIDPDRPRSRYAPSYAREFGALDAQIAAFWRGDSAVVVAGFEKPRASKDDETTTGGDEEATDHEEAMRDDRMSPADVGRRRAMSSDVTERGPGESRDAEAALVVTTGPDAPPVMSRARGLSPYRLAVTVPAIGALVSAEALSGGDSAVAGRARYWLPLRRPPGIAVSQPLLFFASNPDSVPATLEAVFDSMLTATTVLGGRPLGVYWETYLADTTAHAARTTLTVTHVGASWLRRTAQNLGLVRRRSPAVSLAWVAMLPGGTTTYPQSLAVTLPEGALGRFGLEIAMDVGGRVATARRDFEVRE
jgi:hypothetical protein